MTDRARDEIRTATFEFLAAAIAILGFVSVCVAFVL